MSVENDESFEPFSDYLLHSRETLTSKDSVVKMNDVSTSVLFESNSPYFSTNKAVFTIHFTSSQILVVNSVACQLVHYNSDELCSMKLESLIHDSYKQKWSKLKRDFLQNSQHIPCSNEKLIELIAKDDATIVASLYLKQLDSPHKCLVIAELIQRQEGLISIDHQGKILSHDEEVAYLFQYDSSKLVGVHIHTLLPCLCLESPSDTTARSKTRKQYITGRTRNMDAFPVCLTINKGASNSEITQILIWAYPNVSGLLVLSEKLNIRNCTHYFVKLLFGWSRKEVVNEPIVNLLPTFCKDVRSDGGRREINESECINSLHGLSGTESSERCLMRPNWTTDSSTGRNFNSEGVDNQNNVEGHSAFKTLFTLSSREKRTQNVTTFESKNPVARDDFPDDGKKSMDLNTFSEYFSASGKKFSSYGRHSDGTYIDVKYQVEKVSLGDEVYYCVWVFSDWPTFMHLKNESNVSRTSSLNSLSIDSILTKDSTFSESWTRPTNVSMISQCDEVLTAGEYAQNYTNVMEIGKGAFGYVKMAFRNSDGLLVVTKFIKKQTVNISSWVYNPDLNMKIPLEISLLTTIQHPNIVRVLDVFHNDSFVQLVMEKHGAGFDLFEFIDRGPKCDEKLKSYIFRQIVSAVHYLNSTGILHRDIKDENVIINEMFEVKLIDFGSAAFIPPDECFSKFYGTVEYCSPEVLQGNSYRGPELEIWALGVTLYILTFGENPFYDVEDTVKGQFSIPSPVSEELHDLLHRMLDKNVETRITIDEVVENDWVNQSVSIENYKFEEVVRCHENEAHPPKYIYEIHSQDLYPRGDEKVDVAPSTDTYYSDNSLQSRDDDVFKDASDKFCDLFKLVRMESAPQRRDGSPVLMSSTPLKKRNFRLCKSAIGMRKRPENLSTCRDDFNAVSDEPSWFEVNPNAGKLKQLNKSSPNLMETPTNPRKDALIAWDDVEGDLQVRFEKCAFDEEGIDPSGKEPSDNSESWTREE